MKKILIESCSDCPDTHACNHIFLDCPLPYEPEKMKGKLEIIKQSETYKRDHYFNWCIELSLEIELFSYHEYDTEQEARQDALGWAKRLNIQLWEDK